MSVTAWLQHVSVYSWQKIQEDAAIFEDVIMDFCSADSDVKISDFSQLSADLVDVLQDITENIDDIHENISLHNLESLEILKSVCPEIYARYKPGLYSLMINESNCDCLDLGRAWSHLTSLLTDGKSIPPSEVINLSEEGVQVNILGGTPLDPRDSLSVRFQDISQVLDIAEALNSIGILGFQQRFERALEINHTVHPYGWDDSYYPVLLEYYQQLQKFYTKAYCRGFVVANAIC